MKIMQRKSKFMQRLEEVAPHLKNQEERERKSEQSKYMFLSLFGLFTLLIYFGIATGIFYVIYHFVQKYW